MQEGGLAVSGSGGRLDSALERLPDGLEITRAGGDQQLVLGLPAHAEFADLRPWRRLVENPAHEIGPPGRGVLLVLA